MLEELKSKIYSGTKGDLIYFLSQIVGRKSLSIKTIKKACEYGSAIPPQNIDALVTFSLYLKFIEIAEDKVFLSKDLKSLLGNEKEFTGRIIINSFNAIMKLILRTDLFCYDLSKSAYRVKNEFIPITLSMFRDILVNLSVFDVTRTDSKTFFHLNNEFEFLLTDNSTETQRKKTLHQLIRDLEKQAELGKVAELFVMEFEEKRLEHKKPKRISESDVSAGFDILSFETNESKFFDRFIEVKAIGKDVSFFWTKNEKNKAELLGDQYFLYLVDMSKARFNADYAPLIIQNPASSIDLPNWLVEPNSFLVSQLKE